MSEFTNDNPVNGNREQYVIVNADGERSVIRGAMTEQSARRVYHGPWRRTGDRLVYERLVDEWEWQGEDVTPWGSGDE